MQSIIDLLHRAEQTSKAIFAGAALPPGAEGVTLRQYMALEAAAKMTGCSQTELGIVTRIDRSTLADVVSKLARKGLLRRTRTEEDQRSYSISVTPKGKSMLDAMRPVSVGANKRLLALLPKDERDAFLASLAKLAEAPLSAYVS